MRFLRDISEKFKQAKIVTGQFSTIFCCFAALIVISCHISSTILYKNCPLAGISPEELGQFHIPNVRDHLQKMTNFGVKNTGSPANENLTANYIVETIQKIKKNPHNNKNIVYDLQKVSGSFDVQFIENFISAYRNVQNIIVRLKASPKSPNNCLLLNCHFDSVLDSPGASDDIVSCANMLEVLRVLSLRTTRARNCIIFLFNGGEENILQASHGFSTQHSWLRDIRGFVNLEACGAGGNQVLFQSGSGWLLHLYRKSAPFPYGSVAIEDVFGSGMIPSDTDFKIFTRFGNISGLDFAFIVNGYVYHTPDDREEMIDDCTIFKSGNNLLALSRAFLEEHVDITVDEKMVYFDLWSTFFVVFPLSWSLSICVLALFLAAFNVHHRISRAHYIIRSKYLFIYISSFALIILTLICSLVVNLCLSLTFHSLHLRMTWFATPLNLFIYCLPPFLVVMLAHHSFGRMWPFGNGGLLAEMVLESFGFVNVLVSFVMSIYGQGTFVYVAMNSVFIVLYCWLKQVLKPTSPFAGVILRFSAFFVPINLTITYGYLLVSGMTPIMGRSGNFLVSDIIMAEIMAVIVVYISTFMVELFHSDFDCKKIFRYFLFIYVAYLLILYFTPLGFPFSSDRDQPRKRRIIFINACRKFSGKNNIAYKQDCGVYFVPQDSLSDYKIDLGPNTPSHHKMELDDSEPYYGFPFFLPFKSLYGNIYEVDGFDDPSPMNLNKSFRVVSKRLLSPNRTRVTIEIEVVNNCNFVILPVNGIVKRLELTSVGKIYELDSRKNIFIFYVDGNVRDLFKLNFDVESDFDVNQFSTVAKFSVSWTLFGHNMHLALRGGDQMDNFVEMFPDWVTPSVIRAKYISADL